MKGVLDRFTDQEQAVILIEEINQEIVVPTQELPHGSEVNTWFQLEERDGEFVILSIDEKLTSDKADKSSELMKKLQAKKKKSKFKRRDG